MKFHLLILLWFLFPVPLEATELEEAIEAFWTALQEQDKATAMQYVHPEDLNHFLNRQQVSFRNWELAEIDRISENRTQATVSIERFLLNAWLPFDVEQVWQETDSGWRLRVEPPKSLARRVVDHVRAQTPEEPLSGELRVFPRKLTFYRAVPDQPAAIRITNGLDSTVKLLDYSFDKELFQLVEAFDTVEPGSTSKIWLRYRGEDRPPNQESVIRFRLQMPGEIQEFEVPVIYNFENDLTRWMEGQEAQKPEEPE